MNKIIISDSQLLSFLAVAAIIIFWAANGILLSPDTALDDAYITLHNAQLYIGQKEFSAFGDQSSLVGSTSLVHTCMIALFLVIGISAETALALTNVLCAIIYMLAAASLIELQVLSRKQKLGFLFIAFAMAMAPYQLTNGLETGLAMAVVLWAIFAYEKGGNTKKFLLPLLLGLMPIIRPELVALAGLFFLLLMYECYQQDASVPSLAKQAVIILLLAVVSLSPFLFLAWLDSGTLFPNTINAKKYFFAEGCQGPIDRTLLLLKSLSVFVGPLLLINLFIPYLKSSRLGKVLMLFSGVFLGAYWINGPGTLVHNMGRYFYVLLPILFYAGLLYAKDKDLKNNKHWLFSAVLAQTVLGLGIVTIMIHNHIWFVENYHKGTANWLAENSRTTDTILVHDVGYLGYMLSDRKVIDIVGLKTAEIANFHKRITWESCGKERGRAIAEIVQTYKPAYVAVFSWWDEDFELTKNIKDVANITLAKDLEGNPAGYFVYKITYD